ncbi:MAG: hypothetical protein IJV67_01600 [Clostridia bacterium]|nr:hypothetical protein [Clostridia bacterium]
MKTYHINGIASDNDYIYTDGDLFTVQIHTSESYQTFFYTGDCLVRELDCELVSLYDKFRDLYFHDLDLYYKNLANIPIGIYTGGHSSENSISKDDFLTIKDKCDSFLPDLNKYIYLGDCQYLVSTVQNLIQSIEHCFIQYYIQISEVELPKNLLNDSETYDCSSPKSMNIMFYVETFFTKMYSILDMMVKIVYELENPVASFSSITKLKCSEKLWGDKKRITINGMADSIFEDCETIRKIESLRNEAVHNGSWEFRPKIFFRVENNAIIERYMLFPDFDEGRLSTLKNRKHFFSSGTKINDALVEIHSEFYKRLLFTIKYIKSHI